MFPVDTPVTFRCKTITVEGFVAWVEAPLAGIGFDEAVDPEEALRTVTGTRKTPPKDFRRPGLRAQSLTEVERKSVEEWARPHRPRPGE